jgi:repressor LexA
MAYKLTDRQRQVFDFIRETTHRDHRPPTVREIAKHFGFRSPKAVTDHLSALQRKGYITRSPRKSRNIEICSEFATQGIPVVGRIAAGSPILAVENLEGSLSLESLLEPTANTLAVRVHGDSMREAGILDGDYVVVDGGAPVRSGAIGVVRIGDEATVKRVFFEGATNRLQAENPDFQDITLGDGNPQVEICGPVRGVVRRL